MMLEIKRACRFGVFFFNDTATTEIYTLSLHDALPIFSAGMGPAAELLTQEKQRLIAEQKAVNERRSEEHTSELQSHLNLVCRLLLEKKNDSLRERMLRAETLTLKAEARTTIHEHCHRG